MCTRWWSRYDCPKKDFCCRSSTDSNTLGRRPLRPFTSWCSPGRPPAVHMTSLCVRAAIVCLNPATLLPAHAFLRDRPLKLMHTASPSLSVYALNCILAKCRVSLFAHSLHSGLGKSPYMFVCLCRRFSVSPPSRVCIVANRSRDMLLSNPCLYSIRSVSPKVIVSNIHPPPLPVFSQPSTLLIPALNSRNLTSHLRICFIRAG